MENYLTAFIFSAVAGLSTVIGGLVTFFIKTNSLKYLSFGLGLSAGVMLFVSFDLKYRLPTPPRVHFR